MKVLDAKGALLPLRRWEADHLSSGKDKRVSTAEAISAKARPRPDLTFFFRAFSGYANG